MTCVTCPISVFRMILLHHEKKGVLITSSIILRLLFSDSEMKDVAQTLVALKSSYRKGR